MSCRQPKSEMWGDLDDGLNVVFVGSSPAVSQVVPIVAVDSCQLLQLGR